MAFLVFSVSDSNKIDVVMALVETTNNVLRVTSHAGDAVTKLPRCEAEHMTDDKVLNELHDSNGGSEMGMEAK